MNPFLSREITQRLRHFATIDIQALGLRELVLSNPQAGFDSESFASTHTVEDEKYDFLIDVMGIEIYAYYSKFLKKTAGTFVPMGRFEFFRRLRDPRIDNVFDDENLLVIEFSHDGNFQILDDNLNCRPDRGNIAYSRDVIMTQLVERLHMRIFEHNSEQ